MFLPALFWLRVILLFQKSPKTFRNFSRALLLALQKLECTLTTFSFPSRPTNLLPKSISLLVNIPSSFSVTHRHSNKSSRRSHRCSRLRNQMPCLNHVPDIISFNEKTRVLVALWLQLLKLIGSVPDTRRTAAWSCSLLHWESNYNYYHSFGDRSMMFGNPFPMCGDQNYIC